MLENQYYSDLQQCCDSGDPVFNMYEYFLTELSSKADQLIGIFQEGIQVSNRTFWYGALVTIIGWFVVSIFSIWVARYTQKKATEHQARMDVYRQLYELKQKVDTAAVRLYGALEPTVMETRGIVAFAGVTETYRQYWNEFTKQIEDAKSDYDAASQEYRSFVDAWSYLFPKVETITAILFDDLVPPVDQKVNVLWVKLLTTEDKPYKDWPMNDFKEEAEVVRLDILKIMFAFIGDHFDIVSNELFAGVDKKWRVRSRDHKIEKNVEFQILTLSGPQTVKGKREIRQGG